MVDQLDTEAQRESIRMTPKQCIAQLREWIRAHKEDQEIDRLLLIIGMAPDGWEESVLLIMWAAVYVYADDNIEVYNHVVQILETVLGIPPVLAREFHKIPTAY